MFPTFAGFRGKETEPGDTGVILSKRFPILVHHVRDIRHSIDAVYPSRRSTTHLSEGHRPLSQLPLPGQVADLVEDSRVIAAVCLEDRKGKLRMLTEAGREINISHRQVLHVQGLSLDILQNRETLTRMLQARAAAREALAATVEITELWEILKGEDSDFSIVDLVELLFGNAEDDSIAAMLSALYRDRVYFRSRGDLFHPTDPDTVAAILTQRAREEEKEARAKRLTAWVRSVWEGQPLPQPSEAPVLIEMLKDVVLNGEEAASRGPVVDTLRAVGLHNENDVYFQLLVRMGEWDRNENLLLLRLGTRQALSPEASAEAEQLAQTIHWPWQEEPREDLTDKTIYTVDSASTQDVDDALSLTALTEGWEVGIHITDVAAVIHRESGIDEEARLRATSLYLPDRYIPMLPPVLSENLCSLTAGALRPAISLFVTVNAEGAVCGWRFSRTLLRVAQRMTYDAVDAVFAENREESQDLPWHRLLDIARSWRAARQAEGALFLTFPEVSVTVDAEGTIQTERFDRERDSQLLVSEMMIQTNHLAATTLRDAGIPCLYRGQAAPRERLFEGVLPDDLWINYRQRMLLFRAENKTEPTFHHGLGLDAYAMTSSPLRRYTDLINQRQLTAYLTGEVPPYSVEDLNAILAALDRPVSQSSLLEQNRRRFWLLRQLEEQRGIETMALVVAIYGQRIQITLPEWMLETNLSAGSNPDLQPGQWLQVRVTRVQAMEDILRVVVVRTQVT